jgi:hypothetical protein
LEELKLNGGLMVAIAQTKTLAMAVKNQRSQLRITNLISQISQYE